MSSILNQMVIHYIQYFYYYNKNITIDSWHLAYSNISIYKNEFKEQFMLIYNADIDWKSKFQIFINKDTIKKTLV